MLVSMGENDNTVINYASCDNINDGRGYTIGQVGFCTGTGDFIVVARCYNDRKPNNVLSKYWNALVQINDAFWSTGMNQASTSAIDAVGDFKADIATAAGEADGIFDRCQDDVGDADYMAAGFAHAQQMGLQGVLTLGFLYDTELNFGEGDDPGGLGGTATIIQRANADYGANLPSNFNGLPWEESRWLGFLIQERVVEMSGNRTWRGDMDQNATWEAARRLHTAQSNSPESGTDLSMQYDEVSAYKAGSSSAGTPCWSKPPLASTGDSQSTVYVVSLDKSASATDQTKWAATSAMGGNYQSCPSNPTP
jgi:chitosanase